MPTLQGIHPVSPNHLLITHSPQHHNLLRRLKRLLPQVAVSNYPTTSALYGIGGLAQTLLTVSCTVSVRTPASQSARVRVAFCAPRPAARPAGCHAVESRRSSPCSERFDDREQRQEPPGSAASSAPSPARGSRRARARRWQAGSPIRAGRR